MTLAPAAEVDGAGKTGIVVADVDSDGAAAQRGIRTGDVSSRSQASRCRVHRT